MIDFDFVSGDDFFTDLIPWGFIITIFPKTHHFWEKCFLEFLSFCIEDTNPRFVCFVFGGWLICLG